MKYCHTIIWFAVVIIYLSYTGIEGFHDQTNNAIIVEINATSAVFQCNKQYIVRCYGLSSSLITWQIDYSVILNTSLAARCFVGRGCTSYNNFTERYSYDFNSSTGISDLIISKVINEDDGREYKCNDGTPKPLMATVVDIPDSSSFTLRNETNNEDNGITFYLEADCTTVADKIEFEWFSTAEDGSNLTTHNATVNEIQCTDGECIIHGKTFRKSSSLELETITSENGRQKRATGQGRIFGANVTYDSIKVPFQVPGIYKLKDDSTTVNITTDISESPSEYMFIIIIAACIGFVLIVCGIGVYVSIRKSCSNQALNRNSAMKYVTKYQE